MTELCITATPTFNSKPQRLADFATLPEALDYAAEGCTGFNFHDNRGRLLAPLGYVEVRRRAIEAARRLMSLGLERGDRVAVIADTDPAFMEVFFGCQYAGLVPVPMPIPMSIGGHERYVARLERLIESCGARVAIAPSHMVRYIEEIPSVDTLAFHGDIDALRALPNPEDMVLEPSGPDEIAYLQYTSGSTGFPRGVEIRQHAIMANLRAILASGLAVRPQDRCVSWLPFYHDMGLVGFVLGPMASQLSVDYLGPREFAMRPRLWLTLMTRNRGSIAFAPPFGYDLCTRRLHGSDIDRLDLSAWRVAGVGAEPVLPDVLDSFAEHFAAAGFDRRAFLPSYGMAENSLAVSFAPLGIGLSLDRVDRDVLEQHGEARPLDDDRVAGLNTTSFVNCGHPLPGHDISIRDGDGHPLPERHVGRVTIRGPSLMSGYFHDHEQTRRVLGDDGWFDTGDLGYLTSQGLHVTGRHKDLIIINGRNIWPQDIEALASQMAGVNRGELTAMSAPPEESEVDVVVLLQTTLSDERARAALIKELSAGIRSEFGVRCTVSLLPPRTLPRTSSGKISRSQARRQYAAQLREAMDAVSTPSAAASS
ncbi:fatty acyl-AMP ligase [Kushneria phosphatilytica]|uniref:Fatty acyl-AMP ligase n=1 Tax=Kushneria phosphatilytica TaxID=657387 RepID=A0A1S1NS82_9GAMM|nr:fatty acyl-AMP ligase [Kushneria phosphatilytica]OHV07748.1 acyl-CoA synthetase [Kushneria phosphatilytica]QEL10252.1 fatty acyl-AMP ligase [Kushneria phosphatilytica]